MGNIFSKPKLLRARGLFMCCQKIIQLHPFLMCVSCKGSDDTSHLGRLAKLHILECLSDTPELAYAIRLEIPCASSLFP